MTCSRAAWAIWLFTAATAVGVPAAEPPSGPTSQNPPDLRLPPGIEIHWENTLRQTDQGDWLFTGPVTMTWKESRIQADRMVLREQRHIEADGNVLIVWGGNRIFGERIEYDLERERGTIYNAMGSVLSEFLIWAKSVEKIGERTIKIRSAVVTTCTQPVPYWSFRVSRATVTIEGYARMHNVRLRAARAPVLYLPYLVWPVKTDRAAGLLMPEVGGSQQRGRIYSEELFVPLGRSADLSLLGRYFTTAGFGGGGELRFIPNTTGRGDLRGFFIDDQVFAARAADGDGRRFSVSYQQDQRFQNGMRMVADINVISDPQYYSDFERDLNLAASPDTRARVEFSRNGPWASMNARELRRKDLSSGLVQQTLPEIEWRGRSTRLGRTPLYFSFEASFASIQQDLLRVPGGFPVGPRTVQANYWRGDLFPTLSLPVSPFSWLDITPRVSQRWTYWTQRREQSQLSCTDPLGTPLPCTGTALNEDALSRRLWAYDVEFVGPKLYRIFGKEDGSSRYKHTLEARVRYGFAESFDRTQEIINYDDVDSVQGADKAVRYALVQRLFASRPRALLEQPPGDAPGVVLPDGTTVETPPAGSAPTPDEPPAEQPREPLEVASLEISQSRSFDRNLSSADQDGDKVQESTSHFGPIQLAGRYNPSPTTNLDVRATWNVLFQHFGDVTASGSLHERLATLRLSLVRHEGLGFLGGQPDRDDTQMRLSTGFGLLGDRLQLSTTGSYIAQPAEGRSHFPERSWRVRYGTQCCTFYVEQLIRDTADERRELHVRIDLTGVGKILSHTLPY